MENEIEIKLFVSADIEKTLDSLSKNQDVKLVSQSFNLENIYFDTQDKKLRFWDMGLRIRVNDQHIEQTIKTAGQVIGGLHQRPEYNVDIETPEPQLALFPQQIWPEGTDVSVLQKQINPLFNTNFSRRGVMMIYPDGAVVEMVYDQGFIGAGDHKVEICEVELELVKGKPELIFELAGQLAKQSPLRFGTKSKAARGYQLAKQTKDQVKSLTVVDICTKDSLETAYIKTVSHGLAHWQYHIEVFIDQQDFYALKEIRDALQLIIKANELYQDYFHDNELKALTKSIFWLMEQLAFIDDALRIEKLLGNKGQAFKKLEHHKKILAMLSEQRDNLPQESDIVALFNSERHTALVSQLMQWLYFKPWQQQPLPTLEKFQQQSVKSQAKQFLAQDWELVHKTLPYESTLTYQDYLAQRLNLQHNMQVGVCVGNLFDSESQQRFRAPWSDIAVGIDQLLQFEPIKQLLRAECLDDDGAIKSWLERKESSLIHAMEQSRKSALKLTPYWL
ncbi:CYTH and CHAD domain-containing protein [Psychrobium sp. 1_MG-2023]|uniref:CYTH and CHAD domain-containing protein n=1 Tax=Psychrobium sp. 1_MG-2023 TaxID=3062624 RepID=UPI000C3435DE|nr:CYTH and CHAD domain-containing protein [Psychrobium sp. 1_MG-2023]MDP2562239.1 CYTH domain-containing protein [Psychrobium sp. 1_MG-2023]PKF57491.1 inorganic triphosphatase [Alteromonadales bacterium alter-6D02]